MWLVNKNLTKTQIFLNGTFLSLVPKNWKSLIRALQFYYFLREHAPRHPLKTWTVDTVGYSIQNLLATSIFIETFETSWKWWFGGVWQDFENWPSFGLVMELSKNFTVRSPKCHSDDKHHKTTWNRWFRGVRQYLEIGHHMGYFLSPNQNFTEIYHYN